MALTLDADCIACGYPADSAEAIHPVRGAGMVICEVCRERIDAMLADRPHGPLAIREQHNLRLLRVAALLACIHRRAAIGRRIAELQVHGRRIA